MKAWGSWLLYQRFQRYVFFFCPIVFMSFSYEESNQWLSHSVTKVARTPESFPWNVLSGISSWHVLCRDDFACLAMLSCNFDFRKERVFCLLCFCCNKRLDFTNGFVLHLGIWVIFSSLSTFLLSFSMCSTFCFQLCLQRQRLSPARVLEIVKILMIMVIAILSQAGNTCWSHAGIFQSFFFHWLFFRFRLWEWACVCRRIEQIRKVEHDSSLLLHSILQQQQDEPWLTLNNWMMDARIWINQHHYLLMRNKFSTWLKTTVMVCTSIFLSSPPQRCKWLNSEEKGGKRWSNFSIFIVDW